MTPTIGRSHGIHAEPTTFGLKLARPTPSSRAPASACVAARREIATCAISGAVGTFANIDPRVEEHVAEKMGLAVEPVSTQVIPRDRHAMYLRHARRRRLVDRAAGDRDPPPAAHRGAGGRGVLLAGPEGLLGHAAQAQPGADREPDRPRPPGRARPWSRRWRTSPSGTSATSRHSSVERDDRARRHHHLDFALAPPGRRDREAASIYPENMRRNLDRLGGLVHSQRVLLALTQKGVSAARTPTRRSSATP